MTFRIAGAIAGDGLEGRVHVVAAALRVGHDDRVGRILHRLREGAQLVFRFRDPFRHVVELVGQFADLVAALHRDAAVALALGEPLHPGLQFLERGRQPVGDQRAG
jgi:hypothetical protein